MKKRRNWLLLCLVFTVIFNTRHIFANEMGGGSVKYDKTYGSVDENIMNHDNSIDEIDARIIAYNVLLHSLETCNNTLDYAFVPLYDDSDNIIAYYMEFKQGGYVVINNNNNNPAVIEYGYLYNPLIHNMIAEGADKIIYDCPFSVRKEKIQMDDESFMKYSDYNEDLLSPNYDYANMILEKKNMLTKQGVRTYDDYPDWGVYYISGYGSEGTGKTIKYANNQSWMTDSLYASSGGNAEDFCGTLAGTNLALVFAAKGYNRLKHSSPLQTFIDVSDYIPTQPTVFIASGCSGYCSSNAYNLNYSTYNITGHDQSYLYGKVKNAVNANHPSIVSVWNSTENKGHWMVSLGWREYNSAYKYIQVLNGWEDSDSYFFRFQSIPMVSVTDYSIAAYNNDSGAYVTRLYTYCFSREPDIGGLISWVNVLLNNIGGGGTVAHGFFFSQEYLNLGKSNNEYVSDLYYAMLGRSPDSGGLNNWLNALNSGHSREFVFNGFANSVEFSNLCDTYGIAP